MATMTATHIRPEFAEILPRFRALAEIAESAGAMQRVDRQLGLVQAPGLVRHLLVQFRLYPDGLRIPAVYFSALSSGYLTADAIPFPLRQIGVKMDVSTIESPEPEEIYIEPVSISDASAWFVNGSQLDDSPDTIGYGIQLGQHPRALERYHWSTTQLEFHRRTELRTNLVTGTVDKYFRYRMRDGIESIPRHDSMSIWDQARLTHMLAAVEHADAPDLDPILIYSCKKDSTGTPHLALYLTSTAFTGPKLP